MGFKACSAKDTTSIQRDSEVKYGSAFLDENGSLICIDTVRQENEVNKDYRHVHRFFCPCCCDRMIPALGRKQAPHFRHKTAPCKYENYIHTLAEKTFMEEYEKCLNKGLPFTLLCRLPIACNKACVLREHNDCKEHYVPHEIDLTSIFTKASIEQRVPIEGEDRIRRPDILLEAEDGRQLWVEIWYKHETTLDKRNDGLILEIRIKTENDLKLFREHRIEESEPGDKDVRVFNKNLLQFETERAEDIILPCDSFYVCEFDSSCMGFEFNYCEKPVVDSVPSGYFLLATKLNWNGNHYTVDIPTRQYSISEFQRLCREYILGKVYNGSASIDSDFRSLIVAEKYSSSVIIPVEQNLTQIDTPIEKSVVELRFTATHLGSSSFKSSVSPPKIPRYNDPGIRVSYETLNAPSMEISVEWVDLGLPSGRRWAKESMPDRYTFSEARRNFGYLLPKDIDAKELRKHCKIVFDSSNRRFIVTGPNGNEIYISKSKETATTSIWLAFSLRDREFAQRMAIDSSCSIWINDGEAGKASIVHLVK